VLSENYVAPATIKSAALNFVMRSDILVTGNLSVITLSDHGTAVCFANALLSDILDTVIRYVARYSLGSI